MARVLIVGGGCRGRELARGLVGDGQAVRITTRSEAGRPAIEAAWAECFVGSPDRIASLRYALEGVTVVCWLLGSVGGSDAVVAALHGSRLDAIVGQVIDTTVRGFVYEAAGTVATATLAAGARLVVGKAGRNRVPVRLLDADPADREAWLAGARAAIDDLLAGLSRGVVAADE
jgi:hypothetical protein